jgi:hypothetical protein
MRDYRRRRAAAGRPVRANNQWFNSIKHRYGITREEYDALTIKQGGLCAICKGSDPRRGKSTRLFVDHDHETGRVRGLLCHRCNVALGGFSDDIARLRAAANYLEEGVTT